MKMKFLTLSLISCFSFTHYLTAQTSPIEHDSKVLLEKGMEAYRNEELKKAIDFYQQIPEGDTNYYTAQYELGLAYLVDTQYDKAIATNTNLMKLYKAEERQLLLNIGSAYSYKNDKTKALEYYAQAAQKYPNDHRPIYETGVIYFQQEDYDKAAAQFQKSLLHFPYHFRSHWLLGATYFAQGRISEAFIALQAALNLTSDIDEARNVIVALNDIALQSDETVAAYKGKKSKYNHDMFDEIDELLHSKVAFTKDFKVIGKIDDKIVRQMQVIFEKINYDKDDNNFVMQYYVPFLADIRDKKLFESYILYIFSDYGIETIDKYAGSKKGKSKIGEIYQLVNPYNDLILATRELNFKKRSLANAKYMYNSRNNVYIEAKSKDLSFQNIAAGTAKFYQSHLLLAEGEYNDKEEKVGTWKYYYPNGNLKMVENFKNGNPYNGKFVKYFENGNIDYSIVYDSKQELKERMDYNFNGTLASTQERISNGNIKLTRYHPNGKAYFTSEYLPKDFKDQADGTYTVYHTNGKLHRQYIIKNGKRNGDFKEYFDNGQLKSTATYKDGNLDGKYSSFFRNGSPDAVYNYVNGKPEGASIDYFNQSNSYYTQNYKNGILDGTVERFNNNKKLYATVVYKNGAPIKATYLDADGKTIKQLENAKGIEQYEVYNEYGVKTASYTLDKKGELAGPSKKYFDFGGLQAEEHFTKDGEKDGIAKYYHENGALSHTRIFKNGKEDGFYQGFEEDGSKEIEGYVLDGNSVGLWKTFYADGTLSKSYFLLDDQKNGPEKNYYLNGKIRSIHQYDNGVLVNTQQFDSLGKVFHEKSYPVGKGTFETKYANGNLKETVNLEYGLFNGLYKYYGADKQLIEQSNFLNGKRNGAYEYFYPNGNVWAKGTYDDGDRKDKYTLYDINGNIIDESNYEDGQLSGASIISCSGMMRYKNNYFRGKKHGKNYLYGENGKVAGIMHFDNGFLLGYSYIGKDGKEVEMIPVKNATAKIITFYEGGEKAMEFNWDGNKYEGAQKLYYSNGQLAENRTFKKGMYHGKFERWNPDGSNFYSCNYENDRMVGEEKIYDSKGVLTASYNYVMGMQHGPATVKGKDGTMKKYNIYYGDYQ